MAYWSAEAEADLDRIHGYLELQRPAAAAEFAGAVLDLVDELLAHPELGAPVEEELGPGYRSAPLHRHHRLFYRVEGDTLLLARIWDTRRDPGELDLPP